MKSVEERLRQLPQIADEMGIEAGEALKRKILRSAEEAQPPKKHSGMFILRYAVPAMCALVLIVGAAFSPWIFGKQAESGQAQDPLGVNFITAGNNNAAVPGEMTGDMLPGSIGIRPSANPSYRSIWAGAKNGNFPLIGVNGRYYRLLKNPTSIPGSLLGENLGTVNVFTDEPALAGNSGVISNTVAEGEAVYAISGMKGAVVAARVDGEMRAFQRVSFGDSALMGGEDLSDTLRANQVVALELTGVGTINNAETARNLMGILMENASFQRSGSRETNTALLIQLDNGLTLQLAVNEERVMACGTWTCPEFFEAFQEALQ